MILCISPCCRFFFFNDTATTEIYTLSLHDALPICGVRRPNARNADGSVRFMIVHRSGPGGTIMNRTLRSEEHTSELQSPDHLVCRLLLEKKKQPTKLRLSYLRRSRDQARRAATSTN